MSESVFWVISLLFLGTPIVLLWIGAGYLRICRQPRAAHEAKKPSMYDVYMTDEAYVEEMRAAHEPHLSNADCRNAGEDLSKPCPQSVRPTVSEITRALEEVRAEMYNEAKEHKRIRDELREQLTRAANEATKRRGPCIVGGCDDDANANYPVCYNHRQELRALQKRSERG